MNRLTPLFVLLASTVTVQGAESTDPHHALNQEAVHSVSSKTTALGLDQLLDLAFERNPDLQAAKERIGQAEAQVDEATAAFYPNLTGAVGYSYTNNPALAFSAIVSQRRYEPTMNINQPGFVENFRPELIGSMSLFRGGQDYYR